MRAVKIMLVVLAMIGVCGSAGAETFRFTASADNRPGEFESGDNFDRWVYMLGQMAVKVVDEGVFHIMPGDFDSPWITDTSLKAQFGDGVVWYPVVGNHEAETLADMNWIRGAYSELPYIVNSGPTGCESTTYSFDYGNAHFVAINEYYDGTSDTVTDGDVVDALYNWLVDDLNNNTKPVVFVIGHEPAYPQGFHVGDSLDGHPANRDRFWKLLNDMKVIAYLCGHTHYYSALQQAQTGTYPCDAFTWQIDCGNAGNPREMNQTFVDVTVTSDNVIFTTWQGTLFNEITGVEVPFDITDDWMVQIPAPIVEAHNPSPADEATQVAVDAVLSWRAGIYAESHDVYFGTPDDPLRFIQNQLGTNYDPGLLDYEITYYWRIDEFDGLIMHEGYVWSFTTEVFVPELPWSDDFKTGSFAAGGWTTSGNASVSSKADYSDTYGAEIKGTSWIEKAVSTEGFSNINIKYVCKTKGLDNGEYLYVEWYDGNYWDGSYWHELEATQDTAWSSQNLTCGAGADNNAAFKVRFRTNASNSAEYAYVDDVEIYESTVVTAPGQASDPSPANEASNVAVTAEMSWTAGAGAQSHDVYFGTDPGSLLLESEGQSTTTYDPGTLVNDTMYHWRIDEKNSYGTTPGQVWSFTTQSAGTTEVYVNDIDMDYKVAGVNRSGIVTVWIKDTSGAYVEDATVYGNWSGLVSGTASGITGVDGKVTLQSSKVKSGGTFTFTVTDVAASGYTYNPALNVVETSDWIDVP